MRTFLRGIAVILGVVLLAPASTYAHYLLRGYHVGVGTGYSAEVSGWIVENDLSAEECYKVRASPFALFPGPEFHTLVSGCIVGVARKAENPSACELLLPGAAGWECLDQTTGSRPCLFDFQATPSVRGNGIAVPLDSCRTGAEEVKGNVCCAVGRSVFLDPPPSCDGLRLPAAFADQCHFEAAKKYRQAGACSKVTNGNLRRACEVGVAALLSLPRSDAPRSGAPDAIRAPRRIWGLRARGFFAPHSPIRPRHGRRLLLPAGSPPPFRPASRDGSRSPVPATSPSISVPRVAMPRKNTEELLELTR